MALFQVNVVIPVFKLSHQAAEFEEQIKKLKATISEKEKEIEEQRKIVSSKGLEINEIKENCSKEKEEMKKEVRLNDSTFKLKMHSTIH